MTVALSPKVLRQKGWSKAPRIAWSHVPFCWALMIECASSALILAPTRTRKAYHRSAHYKADRFSRGRASFDCSHDKKVTLLKKDQFVAAVIDGDREGIHYYHNQHPSQRHMYPSQTPRPGNRWLYACLVHHCPS